MGVQQSAGPVSVHCEGVEGADVPSVSLVTNGGGGDLQLMGLWLAHSHGGVGEVSLSHNSTVTKTQHQSPQSCHVH